MCPPPSVVYALDRASFNQGQNARFDYEITDSGINSTIVAKGPSAVCYEEKVKALHTRQDPIWEEEKTPCLTAGSPHGQASIEGACGVGLDASQVCHTLIARMETATGTTQDNLIISDYRKSSLYIVRRLTPIECARLQGFPDHWGEIEEKEDFTDEEYRFWLEVRNTSAAITDKTVKEYTKKQMLTWYNKLHTDSAEYKMWGNGIALPTALYVMQGISDHI